MKFVFASLLVAFVVVTVNAISLEKLEKVENVETNVSGDKVEPASAEAATPVPDLKGAEPVEIVEAKSEDVEKPLSVEKVEPELPAAVNAETPEKIEPAEAENSEKVNTYICIFHLKFIYDFKCV